jgi:hypothetical protein
MTLTGETKREYDRKWIAKRRSDFFQDKTCVNCDSSDRLELDHKDPALKIDHKIWSWSEVHRNEEIAKCQVLCHDCHVKKTTENKEHALGENNGQTNLTNAQVLEIRAKAELGIPYRTIAAFYGMDKSGGSISDIVNRKKWKHI